MTFLHDIIDPLLLSDHVAQLLPSFPQLYEYPIFLLLPGLDLPLIPEDPRQFLLHDCLLYPDFVLRAAEELVHSQDLISFYEPVIYRYAFL